MNNVNSIMDAAGVRIALLLLMAGVACGSASVPTKSLNTSGKTPEGFYFATTDVYAKNSTDFKMANVSFTGKILTEDEISRFTVDEKCSRGVPLSAAWQYYGPYAKPKVVKGKIGVEGIFPHLINKMLHVCCNRATTVKYGKILGAIQALERQLDQPKMIYDFTFPVTGRSLGDESFKDIPYVPFVQAPRVALLVRDKTEDSKTSQLLNTVFKAWPILIFILVAATLSGIIIWLLVSFFVNVNQKASRM